eukprot:216499-Hanusia_phi.AAC.1
MVNRARPGLPSPESPRRGEPYRVRYTVLPVTSDPGPGTVSLSHAEGRAGPGRPPPPRRRAGHSVPCGQ